jgi:hypothetical protein
MGCKGVHLLDSENTLTWTGRELERNRFPLDDVNRGQMIEGQVAALIIAGDLATAFARFDATRSTTMSQMARQYVGLAKGDWSNVEAESKLAHEDIARGNRSRASNGLHLAGTAARLRGDADTAVSLLREAIACGGVAIFDVAAAAELALA